MPVRLKYVLTNLVDGATLTVGGNWTEDSSFPKTNLYNERMSQRGGFITAKDGNIVIDLGSAQQIRCCALMNHNLTSTAIVTIEGHTADSWSDPDVSRSFTYAENDMLKEIPRSSKRYWRLVVDDSDRSANDIKIGELILGNTTEISKNFNWNLESQTRYNNSILETTGGDKWVYELYNRKSWSMKWSQLTSDELADVTPMVDTLSGALHPFLMILESTPYYVRSQNNYNTDRPIAVENIESGYEGTTHPVDYSISLNFEEETRGITS